MNTSDLISDAKDIVGDMADLAQTWTTLAGTTSWQVLIGTPSLTQELQAGGFVENINHEIRIVASTTSWSTSYNATCAAALASGQPVSTLAIGQTLIATEQANRKYRVTGSTYKPGSAWVTLQVRAEDER